MVGARTYTTVIILFFNASGAYEYRGVFYHVICYGSSIGAGSNGRSGIIINDFITNFVYFPVVVDTSTSQLVIMHLRYVTSPLVDADGPLPGILGVGNLIPRIVPYSNLPELVGVGPFFWGVVIVSFSGGLLIRLR